MEVSIELHRDCQVVGLFRRRFAMDVYSIGTPASASGGCASPCLTGYIWSSSRVEQCLGRLEAPKQSPGIPVINMVDIPTATAIGKPSGWPGKRCAPRRVSSWTVSRTYATLEQDDGFPVNGIQPGPNRIAGVGSPPPCSSCDAQTIIVKIHFRIDRTHGRWVVYLAPSRHTS